MLSDERIAELAKPAAEKANECCYRSDGWEEHIGQHIEAAIRTAVREAAEEAADMLKEWREDWAKRHPGPKSGTDGAFDAAYCTALDHAETAIRARIEVPRIPR